MEAVVLHRVGFLEHFCPKQGQDFKPSAGPIYPSMGQVPNTPPPLPGWSSPNGNCIVVSVENCENPAQMHHMGRDVVRACSMENQTVDRSGFSLGKPRRKQLLARYRNFRYFVKTIG